MSTTSFKPGPGNGTALGGSGGRGGVRDREWAVFRVGYLLSGRCYQLVSVSIPSFHFSPFQEILIADIVI